MAAESRGPRAGSGGRAGPAGGGSAGRVRLAGHPEARKAVAAVGGFSVRSSEPGLSPPRQAVQGWPWVSSQALSFVHCKTRRPGEVHLSQSPELVARPGSEVLPPAPTPRLRHSGGELPVMGRMRAKVRMGSCGKPARWNPRIAGLETHLLGTDEVGGRAGGLCCVTCSVTSNQPRLGTSSASRLLRVLGALSGERPLFHAGPPPPALSVALGPCPVELAVGTGPGQVGRGGAHGLVEKGTFS